jgi:DNA-binding NarL/FixJ family response regulator
VTIRVLIVDDERLVRTGLRMILGSASDVQVIGEAADGREAIEGCRLHRPDVILMDIRMPVMDGLEATRRVVTGPAPAPRVIVLTTFDLDEYVYEALRAGASAFLLKDAPEEHLLAAIRLTADGGSLFSPSITRRLIEAYAGNAHDPAATADLDALTPREREVFGLVARGLSNREIAAALDVSEHTAKTHVAHVLQKLDLRDRVQAVVLAYEARVIRPNAG